MWISPLNPNTPGPVPQLAKVAGQELLKQLAEQGRRYRPTGSENQPPCIISTGI